MAKKGEAIIIKKKKGGGHGAAHGGAWKVAYADFVTAMMAFFLVMWLMGSDEETKAAVAHYFNAPSTPFKAGKDSKSEVSVPLGEREGQGENVLTGLQGSVPEDLVQRPERPPGSEALKESKEMAELLKEILEGQIFGVEVTLDHLKFSVSSDGIFQSGKTEFKPEALKVLDRIGQILKGYRGFVAVDGHTDETPALNGQAVSSFEFSTARAVTVMNYLVQKSWIDENRIVPKGSGGRRQLASSDSPDANKKNRRIEFVLSKTQSQD